MKTRLLIILVMVATIILSLLATDQYYLSLQDKEIKKSDWVQNCTPAGPDQVIPAIGLYNHTHSFDLRTCTWNPTEHGGGQINIMSDYMDLMSFSQRQQIGAAILRNSEIPWSSMGSGNNRGIILDFSRAIQESLPDYRQYYQARAEQLISFDIPIIIEDPFRTD